MHYIGIDIVEIRRIREAVDRWGDIFLQRIFTSQEIEAYRGRVSSLAARFAAKEAVMKALGTGAVSYFRNIEILTGNTGKPYITLHGDVKELAAKLGLYDIAVSLSHSRENAVAIAIGKSRAH